MAYLKVVVSLFLMFGCVFSEEGSLTKPCAVEDIECLSKSTETFLEKTSAGIPQYDIKPIDPLFIDMVCFTVKENLMLHFKNVSITGLKNLKIIDFKMDTDAKSVLLSTKENLDITSDLVVELTDISKTFTGGYHSKAVAIGTAKYNYELTKDDKGVEHFDVGPETITCEALEEPEVTLSAELEQTLDKDPDALSRRDEYFSKKAEYRKAAVCKIIEDAFITIVHNIRASAKVLPKSAFFTNV